MGIRRFLRELFRPSPADGSRIRHKGHDLADHVRETMGPLAGGGEGGRLTGHSVYSLLEDETANEQPGPQSKPSQ